MNPIIVPVRNGLHLTRNAVADFLTQEIKDVQILVVNNGSSDGTTEWLRTQDVATMYMNPPRSVAESWNLGLKWVFEQGAEYGLVVNNDVRLRPDTYDWLLKDGGGFVTAVGTNDKAKIEPPLNPPDPDRKRPHPDFSCFLIRKWVYEKVGPFDEDFKGGYVEDASYHVRMHEAGVNAYCLDLPFWHLGAGTIRNAAPEEADRIRKQADVNRTLFKERYGVDVGSDEYYKLFGHTDPKTSRMRRVALLIGEDATKQMRG